MNQAHSDFENGNAICYCLSIAMHMRWTEYKIM